MTNVSQRPQSEQGVLIYGFGNPGRLDDGLGPAFAERIELLQLDDVQVDANYQLSVEDAAAVAQHPFVLFVDAAIQGREPFYLERIEPVRAVSFSSHSVQPPALVALAEDLFGARCEAYILGIRGYQFDEFGQQLSDKALANLETAMSYMVDVIKRRSFAAMLTQTPDASDFEGENS